MAKRSSIVRVDDAFKQEFDEYVRQLQQQAGFEVSHVDASRRLAEYMRQMRLKGYL